MYTREKRRNDYNYTPTCIHTKRTRVYDERVSPVCGGARVRIQRACIARIQSVSAGYNARHLTLN